MKKENTQTATSRPFSFESTGEKCFTIYEGQDAVCHLQHYNVETRNTAIDLCNKIVQAVNEHAALKAVAEAAADELIPWVEKFIQQMHDYNISDEAKESLKRYEEKLASLEAVRKASGM